MTPLWKQRDKQQHFAIGAGVCLVAALVFDSPSLGLAVSAAAGSTIEAWQWFGNILLAWKPIVFGRFLSKRTPDLLDIVATVAGGAAGAVLAWMLT